MNLRHIKYTILPLLALVFSNTAEAIYWPCEAHHQKEQLLESLCVNAGYTSPRGIGREEGYASLGVFFCPEARCGFWDPLLELQGHRLNDGKWAANVGVGLQTAFPTYKAKLRGYAYMDYLQGEFGNFREVSIGAEWLGCLFDARINGYFPLNEHGNREKTRFDYGNGAVANRFENEASLRGLDLEVSAWLNPFPCVNLYSTLGTYTYRFDNSHCGNRNHIFGGLIRFEIPLFLGLNVSLQTSYDEVFKSRSFFQVNWDFPLAIFNGSDSKVCCCPKIRRQEIMPLTRLCYWKTNY